MCLLVQQSADTHFSDAFLRSVFTHNSDGIGVMWAEDGKLHYHKALVDSAESFIEFYRNNIEGKDACWHARMKTHGNIDMENCHPYPVFGFEDDKDSELPMLLMHNGVLSTGNSKDTTKSDTWHYIRDYLRPILADNPDLMFNEAFQKLLAGHIGVGNKFAVMDAHGRAVIINKAQGLTYEGAWLSNTYAWDYRGLHPDAPKYSAPASNYSAWSNRSSHNWGPSYWDTKGTLYEKPPAKTTTVKNPSKRGRKAKQKNKQVDLPLLDKKQPKTDSSVTQELMNQLSEIDFVAYDELMFMDMYKALVATCEYDIQDLMGLLDDKLITTQDFIDAIKNPKTIDDIIVKSMTLSFHEETQAGA